MNSPSIRLFVSSTFRDLKAERDALQRDVYPRLKQLCLSKGLRFQAIDLRWGISEDASRDNQTMRICLRELRRCQLDRPKPNFLVLLGDRYGWRPLPEIIPATLFEKLATQLHSTNLIAARLFEQAYRLDENALPPVAELQPRGDNENWHDTVGTPLRAALETAAAALSDETGLAELAIGLGATHQEVLQGALKLQAKDAREHVHAFIRKVWNLSGAPLSGDFVDPDADTKTQELLTQLKGQLEQHLGDENVHPFVMDWEVRGPDDDGCFTEASLKKFCDDVFTSLSVVIENQIATLAKITPDDQEEQAHQDFGKERCRRFVGRDVPLAGIAAYLRQGSEKPLAVLGPSGSGKSAVMAKSVEAIPSSEFLVRNSVVIARYIGATPASSDLIQLLRNLVSEIRHRYPATVATETAAGEPGKVQPGEVEIPSEFHPLVNALHEALQRPTAEQPLYLFLDALDQLTASHQAHSLIWLPGSLSPHVRLIVSAALPADRSAGIHPADSEIKDPRAAIVAALTLRVDEAQRIMLTPLSLADGEQMLTNWLSDARRKLQPAQRHAVLETFQVEGSPLWLRTATEEAVRLAAWEPESTFLEFKPTTPGLLGQVLDRLSREEEHGDKLVSHCLSYLACARHGLAEDELLEILSADEEVMDDFRRRSPKSPPVESLPVAVWVRLFGDLAFYLAERQAQGASLLGFYHRSFFEAVTARDLGSHVSYLARHLHLASYFERQPIDSRSVVELPWQLCEAHAWDRLYQLLVSPVSFVSVWITSEPDVLRYWSQLEDQSKYRIADGYQDAGTALHPSGNNESNAFRFLVADFLMQKGHLERAEGLYRLLINCYRHAGDDAMLHRCLGNYARILQDFGKSEEADNLQKEVQVMAMRMGDLKSYAIATATRGSILFGRGKFDDADCMYLEAERIRREMGDRLGLAFILGNRAGIRSKKGDLSGAMALIHEQKQVCLEEGAMDILAGTLLNEGWLHVQEGRIEDASLCIKEAEGISRRFGLKELLAQCLMKKATISEHRGSFDEALDFLTEAEAVFRELGHASGITDAVGNQGAVHTYCRRFDEALGCYEESERMSRQLSDEAGVATSIGNQAVVHWHKGDGPKALALLGEEERICRKLGEVDGVVFALFHQARINRALNNLTEAVAQIRGCQALAKGYGLRRWQDEVEKFLNS